MKLFACSLGLVALYSLSAPFAATALAADKDSVDSGSWWAAAAKPYAGMTIRGVTEYTPPSRYVADVLAPAFERETGIRVIVEPVSWEDMHNKSIRDFSTGEGLYDFVYVEQDIATAYLARDYLMNLSEMLRAQPRLASPHFKFSDFTSFLNYFRYGAKKDVFGVPIEAFLKVYMYRKDLFEDPRVKAAFKKSKGYDLRPAQTFQEFRDISAFFTVWGKENKLELWGTTLQASLDHPASFYELFETVLPSFGVYGWGIDQSDWKSTVKHGGSLDSIAAKSALSFWLEMLQYSPPETYGSTWEETVVTFASGRIAHCWMAGENIVWFATDKSRSRVTGNVGTALPPLAPGVMKAAKKGEGYVGYYDGGAFGIPRSSRHKEAALLWLQYLGQPSVQLQWTLSTGRVVHKATMDHARIRELDRRLGGYYSLMKRYGHLFAGAPSFPYHAAIREVIAPFIYKALRKELSAENALDQAAASVDDMLKKLAKQP